MLQVVGRLGAAPKDRGVWCGTDQTCPDVLIADTGDYIMIGRVIGSQDIELPDDVNLAPDECMVLLPKSVVESAFGVSASYKHAADDEDADDEDDEHDADDSIVAQELHDDVVIS